MTRIADTSVFRPVRLKAETRDEITARIAREIVSSEAADRIAKTERLRAARLAQEEVEITSAPIVRAAKRLRTSVRAGR